MASIEKLIHESAKPFFSLEFFPPSDPAQLPAFYKTADKLGALNPLFISVTYGAGGGKRKNTLDVTAELARRGFTTMAHLTCAGSTAASIRDFTRALKDNGVDNILALRGDPPADASAWDWSQGEFQHADDLVRFTREEAPCMGIGVALYPSPHPESPSFEEDRRRSADKLKAGAGFAITQLFFDSREYEALAEDMRKRGVSAPIIPGIITIQSFDGLKRVLSMCGANIPAKLYIELDEANAKGGSEAVREAGLNFTLRQIRRLLDMGAPGVHLYTLNKSDLCARIIEESGLK